MNSALWTCMLGATITIRSPSQTPVSRPRRMMAMAKDRIVRTANSPPGITWRSDGPIASHVGSDARRSCASHPS
jgi:hypothetical protein